MLSNRLPPWRWEAVASLLTQSGGLMRQLAITTPLCPFTIAHVAEKFSRLPKLAESLVSPMPALAGGLIDITALLAERSAK